LIGSIYGMKKKLLLMAFTVAVGGCALVATLTTTGCGTLTGTSGTNSVSSVTPEEKAARLASVIGSTAHAGVVLAATKDLNSIAYFRLAAIAVSQFVTGGDLSPGALSTALASTSMNEFKTPAAVLGITTATSLYDVFYGDYVRSNVDNKTVLVTVLRGLSAGILAGVADVEAMVQNGSLH
jgi:hypothetical protein